MFRRPGYRCSLPNTALVFSAILAGWEYHSSKKTDLRVGYLINSPDLETALALRNPSHSGCSVEFLFYLASPPFKQCPGQDAGWG